MYKIFVLIFLLAALITLNNCGLSDDTIAKVGNQEIRVDEFTSALKKGFPGKESFTDVDSTAKMQVLNRLIDNKRKLAAAYDMNLDDDAELKKAVDEQKDQAIYNKYIENMVVDSVIDLSKVEDYLEKIKVEIKASHILLKFKGSQGSTEGRSKEEAEKLALSLVERIKNGESISILAKEYSDDPSAERNNGSLGYFTWGRMVDEFQKAAFNMESGEVSAPVLTSYGYHVIQVEDRRDNPNYDPENLRSVIFQIKSKLFSEDRAKAKKRWDQNGEDVRKEYNYAINEENIASLIALTKEKNNSKQLNENDFTDQEKELVLAEYDGGKVALNNLFDRYKNKFRALVPKLTNSDKLKQDIENTSTYEIIKIITKQENYEQDEAIQKLLNQYLEQQMITLLDKKVAENTSDIPDDELLTYYEEHLDQYKTEAEIEIWEIYVKDEKIAKKVAQLAKSGKEFEQLEKQYNEDKTTKKQKGYLGYRSLKRRGAVSQKAFEVGPEKVAGPIEYRKGWAVIKTGQLKPEGTKSFEEVKSLVQQKLKREKIQQQRKDWDEEIKEKYQAKINYKLLENI